MSTFSQGTTGQPYGFVFDESGLPEAISYLGKLSISGTSDYAHIIAADPTRQEFGRVPLSSIGTANLFTIQAPLTANASTATLEPGQIRFALRNVGATSLVVFVRDPAGNSFSGSISLGLVI